MTAHQLIRILEAMPTPYLHMPVYWGRCGEGLLVRIVVASPGGMGPEDHPAVWLLHEFAPPEWPMPSEYVACGDKRPPGWINPHAGEEKPPPG